MALAGVSSRLAAEATKSATGALVRLAALTLEADELVPAALRTARRMSTAGPPVGGMWYFQ